MYDVHTSHSVGTPHTLTVTPISLSSVPTVGHKKTLTIIVMGSEESSDIRYPQLPQSAIVIFLLHLICNSPQICSTIMKNLRYISPFYHFFFVARHQLPLRVCGSLIQSRREINTSKVHIANS